MEWPRWRWTGSPAGSAGRTAKKPASGPPSSSAKTGGESIRGAHSQTTRPWGSTSAAVRWSDSSEWHSIGTGAAGPEPAARSTVIER